MAWRIGEAVVRGEIDNRARGRVTGKIWFVGREHPVELNLAGNAWRDVAGHVLRFTNPSPTAKVLAGLNDDQRGQVGDITASRKVKIPEYDIEDIGDCYEKGEAQPWHWGNCLYIEWYSLRNGRVVIETAEFELELDPDAAWVMTEADQTEQRHVNEQAMRGFMERLAETVILPPDDDEEYQPDDEPPRSVAEAEADADAARMDLLIDRVSARLEQEGYDRSTYEQILEEERERLRQERGEPKPAPLTPQQIAERDAWIEEMNAEAQQALEADDLPEMRTHPLAKASRDLGVRLYQEAERADWIPDGASVEHPLCEVVNGVQAASAKLAGALGMSLDGEWPPDSLFAGDVLVWLKKARRYLRDALHGLDAVDQDRLAESEWRTRTRFEIKGLLASVQTLIDEVRSALE